MDKSYKNCQSCGMPLKQDPKAGGTNADGTKNLKYCSYCYEEGNFTRPDITVTEMQQLVKDQLKKMRFPGFIAGLFVKRIPKLERWSDK